MNIKLLGDRVLIEADKVENKTESGIIVKKEEEMGDYMTGTVVAIGNGKSDGHGNWEKVHQAEGNKVIFQYGKPIIVEKKKYLIVLESDIIMVI